MEHLLRRPLSRRPERLVDRIRAILSLRRQRRQLRDLSDQILDDIGATRFEAEREADRPVWDVPGHWLR